jgi:hypothetical protein
MAHIGGVPEDQLGRLDHCMAILWRDTEMLEKSRIQTGFEGGGT